MLQYISVSTKSVALPNKAGFKYNLTIEGNASWKVTPTEEWIELSDTTGAGSTVIEISSKSDNTAETVRTGKIYIYNQELLIDSIIVTQNGQRKSFRIEAEDFIEMLGVQTEATSDEGGGMNLGYVDIDDWVKYNVDISFSGNYEVTIRHAGFAGDFDLSIDSTYLKTIKLSATSGWQDWKSDQFQLEFIEGVHELRFDFNKTGLNINWMDFTFAPISKLVYTKPDGEKIMLYPNPYIDEFCIESKEDNSLYEIFDITGQKVEEGELNFGVNKLGNRLLPGIYIVEISSASKRNRIKFIRL